MTIMTMKKLTLVVILLAIIAFSFAGYFLISKFSPQNAPAVTQTPTVATFPTPSTSSTSKVVPTEVQISPCRQDQLSAEISTQGAAGNIYATLELTNKGKTACVVELGNTVKAMLEAKNIVTHDESTVPTQNFILAPKAKVYSQIHYPNGPQCQNGIAQQQITFLYKTDQTTIVFAPNAQTGKLLVQACNSPTEKTIVDIWPLSKTPINP